MSRVVVEREPEWTPDEVSLFIASRHVERSIGSHGVPMDVATDAKAGPAYRGLDAIRFKVTGPTFDFAEQALVKAKDAFYSDPRWKDAPRDGHLWAVEVDSDG